MTEHYYYCYYYYYLLWRLKVMRRQERFIAHSELCFLLDLVCSVKPVIRQQPAVKVRNERTPIWAWCDSCRLKEISSIFNHYHKQMWQRQAGRVRRRKDKTGMNVVKLNPQMTRVAVTTFNLWYICRKFKVRCRKDIYKKCCFFSHLVTARWR